jgi:hypothetical protein
VRIVAALHNVVGTSSGRVGPTVLAVLITFPVIHMMTRYAPTLTHPSQPVIDYIEINAPFRKLIRKPDLHVPYGRSLVIYRIPGNHYCSERIVTYASIQGDNQSIIATRIQSRQIGIF